MDRITFTHSLMECIADVTHNYGMQLTALRPAADAETVRPLGDQTREGLDWPGGVL